jgi:hypothetical protein
MRQRRVLKRFALTGSLAALSLTAGASQAAASVTIGQLAADPSLVTCGSGSDFDRIQPTVTSGTTYVVPETGVITSWSHNARDIAGQTYKMKVFRKIADPAIYQVVGHDGPHPLTGGVVNTFPMSIAVEPGDVLGVNSSSPVGTACIFPAPGDSYLFRAEDLADGASEAFGTALDRRINISAVLEADCDRDGLGDETQDADLSACRPPARPSNAFTLAGLTRNKKKGTASLKVNVPNPGELIGSGNGAKVAAAGARISKAVTAGTAQLLIKAEGKKKRKLNETGKVKLNVAVTYTPSGGDPSTQSVKVKLKKKF